jgi:MFS family permease
MVGMALLAAGLFVLSRLGPESPFWMVVLGLAVSGLGTGIFISPNNSALMGAAPKHRQGVASGILASGRNVGMVLGIGLAGAILTSHLAASPTNGLLPGIHYGFLAAAVVALLGVVLAAVKER